MHTLRKVKPGRRTPNRIEFMSVPLNTDKTFEGMPVRLLLHPSLAGTGLELQSLFDSWCNTLQDEGTLRHSVLGEFGHDELAQFVSDAGESFGGAAVALLYALGNVEGATLTYNEREIWVEKDGVRFGVADGIVHSRFCDGMNLGQFNPREAMETPRRVRSFDRTFISLYRHAYDLGDDVLAALIALKTGNPKFNFRSAMNATSLSHRPKAREMQACETHLVSSHDPLSRVYRNLVPRFMTVAEFNRVFGHLNKRTLDPSIHVRQNYITALHNFFHKNKNKE